MVVLGEAIFFSVIEVGVIEGEDFAVAPFFWNVQHMSKDKNVFLGFFDQLPTKVDLVFISTT